MADNLEPEPVEDLHPADEGEAGEEAQVATDPADLVAEGHLGVLGDGGDDALVRLKVHADGDQVVLPLVQVVDVVHVDGILVSAYLFVVQLHGLQLNVLPCPRPAPELEGPVGQGGLQEAVVLHQQVVLVVDVVGQVVPVPVPYAGGQLPPRDDPVKL